MDTSEISKGAKMKIAILIIKSVLFICFIGVSIYFTLSGFYWLIPVSYLVAGILIYIDLSGFKVKAFKLLNVLELTLEEAKNTIDELKELAKILTLISTETMKTRMRFRGKEMEEFDITTYQDLIKTLKKIGLEECEIQKATRRWHFWNKYDYVNALMGGANQPPNMEMNLDDWKKKKRDFCDSFPSPDVLRDFLQEQGLISEEIKQYIDDYEYYLKNEEFKSIDRWLTRESLYKK